MPVMSKMLLKIDEIWVHRACTTRPQTDTIWYMFAVRQNGTTQYAWKRYEIGMRVKDKKHSDGGVIPYTRVFEASFDVDLAIPVYVSFLLANYSGDQPYEHLKNLIDRFDSCCLDQFGTIASTSSPALDLVKVVAANLIRFDPVGATRQLLGGIMDLYFTNKDAPVAYDRVFKPVGSLKGGEERMARDYFGPQSQYGVAFKIIS